MRRKDVLLPLERQAVSIGAFCASLNLIAVFGLEASVDIYAFEPEKNRVALAHSLYRVQSQDKRCCAPMAFSEEGARLFFVTEDAVEAWDCDGERLVGFVVECRTEPLEPVGVASRGALVAVSMYYAHCHRRSCVQLFQSDDNSMTSWTLAKIITEGLDWPVGVRFSRDGQALAVADRDGLKLIQCVDWVVGRHWPACNLIDVEEFDQGWLGSKTTTFAVELFQDGRAGRADFIATSCPEVRISLAYVPGLGLATLEDRGRTICFWASPDVVAMDGMGARRTQWMVAVFRSICHCHKYSVTNILSHAPPPLECDGGARAVA